MKILKLPASKLYILYCVNNLIKTTLTPSKHGTGEHSLQEHSALQDANPGTPVTIKHRVISPNRWVFLQTEKVVHYNLVGKVAKV